MILNKPVSARLTTGLVISLTASLPSAWALPQSHRTKSQAAAQAINAIQAQSGLEGITVLAEEDPGSRTLYISPAKKTQSGQYSPVQNASHCKSLESMYAITYSVPPEADFQKAAKEGAYSPFFDYHYGNSFSSQQILHMLKSKIEFSNKYQMEHATEYGAYLAASERYKPTFLQLQEVQAEIKGLNDAITSAIQAVNATSTPEDRLAAKENVTALKEKRDAELPTLNLRFKELLNEESTLRLALTQAYAQWVPYATDLKRTTEEINAVEAIWRVQQSIAKEAFEASEKTLSRFETKVVGRASMNYSIWGDELTRASAVLASHPQTSGYLVTRLPINDVRLAVPSFISETQALDSSGESIGAEERTLVSPGTAPSASVPSKEVGVKTPFTNPDGTPVIMAQHVPVNEGAGTFNALITQGAFCSGTSEREKEELTAIDAEGNRQPLGRYRYSDRSDQTLMSQGVALNYNYYVAAEPVGVECKMDVKRFMDYSRSWGSSRFLFWGRSWDDSVREQLSQNGLECTVTNKPTGADAAMQKDYFLRLQQKFSQEIMQEFLLSYAKSWDVSASTPDPKLVTRGSAFSELSTGMSIICGGQPICSITNVVMKTANELFGNVSGTTSNRERLSGEIVRRYTEKGYRLEPGSVTLQLEVRR